MTDDPRERLLLLMQAELVMFRQQLTAIADLDELVEAGREAGGHWGPAADQLADLVEAVRAYQVFEPKAWWRRDPEA